MSKLTTGISMSLDGFVGGLGDQSWPVHERLLGWKFDLASFRERIAMEGGENTADSRIEAQEVAETGSYIMGRNMFDSGEQPWGDNPPFHAPVFVLTHNEREPLERQGGTTFTFVTEGVESAVSQALAAAGDKNAYISGGASVIQQALKAGLLDEIQIHLVPLLLGQGVPLFEHLGTDRIELINQRAINGAGVVHLRFAVNK